MWVIELKATQILKSQVDSILNWPNIHTKHLKNIKINLPPKAGRPNFNKNLAKRTEPTVIHSTWALGSHWCKKKIGNLLKNVKTLKLKINLNLKLIRFKLIKSKSNIKNILNIIVKDLKYKNALLLSLEGEPFNNKKPKGTTEHSKIKKFSNGILPLRKNNKKEKTINTIMHVCEK